MAMDVASLFSERALNSKDLKRIVADTTNREFNTIKPFIDTFPDLASVDYVSPQFISYLGEFLGFEYLETEDIEVQREMMKRVIDEYHKKGTIEQLTLAANRAYDPNYFMGNMTYYHGDLIEGYSNIQYPRDRMFCYDISRWDRTSVWCDYIRVMPGVVEFQVSQYSDRTLEYLEKMVPGGLKFYVDILRDISGTGDGVNPDSTLFPMKSDELEQELYLDIKLDPYVHKKFFSFDSSKWNDVILDGRDVISSDLWDERPADGIVQSIMFPSDCMMPVILRADEKCIYNENRMYGFIDGIVDVI